MPKPKTDRYAYAYTTGRIRALENKLMDSGAFYRLGECKNYDEVKKVLSDYGYDTGDSFVSFSDTIEKDLVATFKLVQKIIPDKEYLRVLLMENDYQNLKAILKLALPFISRSEDGGTGEEDFPFEELKEYIAKPFNHLPENLVEVVYGSDKDFADREIVQAVREVKKVLKKSPGSDSIDRIVDIMYFERLSLNARDLGNEFFIRYCEFKADRANLEILLRALNMELEKDVFSDFLVKGGRYPEKEMERVFDLKEPKHIKELYSGSVYEKLAGFAGKYKDTESAMEFNKTADDCLTDIMRETKKMLFGPEIALAYVFARQMQAKNINIVLTCIRNGLAGKFAANMIREAL